VPEVASKCRRVSECAISVQIVTSDDHGDIYPHNSDTDGVKSFEPHKYTAWLVGSSIVGCRLLCRRRKEGAVVIIDSCKGSVSIIFVLYTALIQHWESELDVDEFIPGDVHSGLGYVHAVHSIDDSS